MNKIRVLLADDHRLFREGLRRLLEIEGDIEVVGEAKDGQETVELALDTAPDIILLDVNMPKMNGGQVIRALRNGKTSARFVVITAYDDEEYLTTLSASGISGYILKSSGLSELLFALRTVYNGESTNRIVEVASEYPIRRRRSPSEWGSSTRKDRRSKNACAAASNDTPCLRKFFSAFARSQEKKKLPSSSRRTISCMAQT